MATATVSKNHKKPNPTEQKSNATKTERSKRLVEMVVLSADEKTQPFTTLVSALSAKGFEVTRGSRGVRKDGRVIYSVIQANSTK